MVDEQPINLEIYDTAGQEDFDKLRPLSYSDTDVFIVCYSIAAPESFQNIESKWMPELDTQAEGVPFVMVGTKMDLRDEPDEKTQNLIFITKQQANSMGKKIGAYKTVECSALRQKNLKQVFDEACRCVFEKRKQKFVRILQTDGSYVERPAEEGEIEFASKKVGCFCF